jgi:hypothetical protein
MDESLPMEQSMEPDFTTPPDLFPMLEALLAREPLFHNRSLVSTRADFERETTPDLWEVGASGSRYSREAVWAVLARRYAAGAADEARDWHIGDAQVRRLGPDTYLLTYTLFGPDDRITRRLTIWRGSTETGWMSLYHQGTVVQSD